ncbi:SH3 domain-binding glutamic acid-rich-like protein 3 [Megalops cyprinoides]|uniref:SH3 domain-binding glutamic acid-rich-like protein 3 n=1 Tax=Megalops cyprinoides TaxID=118141 RepID=UPI001863FD1C|nr:SH3 domain-binding glutamic acid-rich-like protein 3 [Megalops cyprinoides]
MAVTVYFSSTSASRELKQHQTEIFQYLDANKIQYKAVDITQGSEVKEEMRKKSGNPSAMPPQVFNGDVYCGDYDKFFEAVELGKAEEFFKL